MPEGTLTYTPPATVIAGTGNHILYLLVIGAQYGRGVLLKTCHCISYVKESLVYVLLSIYCLILEEHEEFSSKLMYGVFLHEQLQLALHGTRESPNNVLQPQAIILHY